MLMFLEAVTLISLMKNLSSFVSVVIYHNGIFGLIFTILFLLSLFRVVSSNSSYIFGSLITLILFFIFLLILIPHFLLFSSLYIKIINSLCGIAGYFNTFNYDQRICSDLSNSVIDSIRKEDQIVMELGIILCSTSFKVIDYRYI